ncbi:hypothetical protein ElyMa_005394000 [Elysia marginata]|uniref:Uncharacterized protein n=1 Tax=Elysia marginata TaxID=1093978 RepID=A0AAV4EGF4_9GAST|nr:hypothetical protein ElyMa_005394000 [Elysia marginata]
MRRVLREEEVTNSHWLRALCAQPVDEILGKYRRRTDLHRAHLTMVRSCSTPGERSLVNAWDSNVSRSFRSAAGSAATTDRRRVQGKQVPTMKSAMAGKQNSASTVIDNPDRRTTKSESSLSRVRQDAESVERYGLSPRTPVRGGHKVSGKRRQSDNKDKFDNKENTTASPDGPPQRVKGFLMDEASGDEDDNKGKLCPPRYVSFTTKLFRQTDGKGNATTYSKVTRGPEHLPYISNCKRVSSMVHNTTVYSSKTAQPESADDNRGKSTKTGIDNNLKNKTVSSDLALAEDDQSKAGLDDMNGNSSKTAQPDLALAEDSQSVLSGSKAGIDSKPMLDNAPGSITVSDVDLELTSGSGVNKPKKVSSSSPVQDCKCDEP